MGYDFKAVSCGVCGSNERVFVGRRIPRSHKLGENLIADIVKCKNCALLYPYPMPFADKEQLTENFSDHAAYFPVSVSQARLDFYESFIKKINKLAGAGGRRFLDVGCGRGELLHAARKHGWQAEGTDISSDFAEFAKKRFGVDVRVGDIREMNLEAETFDAVSLIAVLDHVYHPAELLLELHRILKKGGIIFLEVSNSASMLYGLGNMFYKLQGKSLCTNLSPTFPSFQVYGFSKKALSFLLNACGFKILKVNVRGGVSKTERPVVKGLKEKFLRTARKGCFVIADILKKGQILEVYATKG